jgi:hypothetical protein
MKIGDVVPSTNLFLRTRIKAGQACVYAMGPPSGSPLKIGMAANPVDRREHLQFGNWVALVVHRSIFGGPRLKAIRLEHRLMRSFTTCRISGSWFSIDVAAFDAAIREIFRGQG